MGQESGEKRGEKRGEKNKQDYVILALLKKAKTLQKILLRLLVSLWLV
jgi:hypothetical protein